jgi:hypothetical protein
MYKVMACPHDTPWHPHDCFFRKSFGRSDIAHDFLRHHLPVELLDEIDLATLEAVPV